MQLAADSSKDVEMFAAIRDFYDFLQGLLILHCCPIGCHCGRSMLGSATGFKDFSNSSSRAYFRYEEVGTVFMHSRFSKCELTKRLISLEFNVFNVFSVVVDVCCLHVSFWIFACLMSFSSVGYFLV